MISEQRGRAQSRPLRLAVCRHAPVRIENRIRIIDLCALLRDGQVTSLAVLFAVDTSRASHLVLKPTNLSDRETAVDVQEVRKLDAYLKRVFGNPKIRVVPRPKKDDSAEVYIGEEFIGVLFVDDEDAERSYNFQMAILGADLE